MANPTIYRALVEKIIPNGRHGAYAVARSATIGPITFLLCQPVWQEDIWPESGTFVMLSGLMKKRAGWGGKPAPI